MSKTKPNGTVSAFDLLPKSFNLIKENLSIFAIIYSIPLLTSLLGIFNRGDVNDVSSTNVGANFPVMLGVGAGLAAIILVLSVIAQVMSLGLCLKVAKGGTSTLGELWEMTRTYFFRLFGLAIVLGVLFLGGLLLLIVPGFIVLRRYFLSPYVMVDQNLGITDSMRKSAELSKDYAGSIWGVIGVTILLSLVPSFLGPVGELVGLLLGIAYSVAPALRYVELQKLAPKGAAAPAA